MGAVDLPGLRGRPPEVSQMWIANEDYRLHPGKGGSYPHFAASANVANRVS